MLLNFQVETEELHTFEQLQSLLTTVQEELDSMRDNPLVRNYVSTIQKKVNSEFG